MNKTLITIFSLLIIIGIVFISYKNINELEPPKYKTVKANKIEKLNEENHIVYFYQNNCPGCKKITPELNKFINNTKKEVYALNVNDSQNTDYVSQDMKIKETPTLIFYKNNREVYRKIGYMSYKDIKSSYDKINN
ncbi:thioredoxin family protein [Macrococcus animalis]|uniref:thioredoxin family protein n=1 Tax=Macrococcus animalis TaxID=3395467 RepID=UPI0039BDD3AF